MSKLKYKGVHIPHILISTRSFLYAYREIIVNPINSRFHADIFLHFSSSYLGKTLLFLTLTITNEQKL